MGTRRLNDGGAGRVRAIQIAPRREIFSGAICRSK
jgi:hypothetical protein